MTDVSQSLGELYTPRPLPKAERLDADEDDLGFTGPTSSRDLLIAARTLLLVQALVGAKFFSPDESLSGKGKELQVVITRALWFRSMKPHFAKKKLARIADRTPLTIRSEQNAIDRWGEQYGMVGEFIDGVCDLVNDAIPLILDTDRFFEWASKGLSDDRAQERLLKAAKAKPTPLPSIPSKSARQLEVEAIMQAAADRRKDAARRIDLAVVNNPDADLRDVARAKARLKAG